MLVKLEIDKKNKLATEHYLRYGFTVLAVLKASLLLCLFISCKSSPDLKSKTDTENISVHNYDTPSVSSTKSYDYDTPDYTYILDQSLNEISGLSYDSEKNDFITNDDENGAYYILNAHDFSIEDKIDFGKKGDYESIEKLENDIVICKNNGTLYFYNEQSKETATYKTPLSLQNDVEGLCHLQDQNILLLACKGQPYFQDKKRDKNAKCIYAFDIVEKSLHLSPFITIYDQDLKNHVLNINGYKSKSDRKKLIKRIKEFAPSGIAIQPDSKDFYILSARGSTLVILDKNKILKRIVYLDKNTIPQPEGITFDRNGNLYIATEGRGFNGKIFQFKKINK